MSSINDLLLSKKEEIEKGFHSINELLLKKWECVKDYNSGNDEKMRDVEWLMAAHATLFTHARFVLSVCMDGLPSELEDLSREFIKKIDEIVQHDTVMEGPYGKH